ncbi:MAG: DUF1854 domain-containing protein [Clostridia bacterium]|nr:DUF1854 domain-containing protein [Clostridia bacterium]MBQ3954430.1 DUF1854 domain-containing protein [Clostridia bacterium]
MKNNNTAPTEDKKTAPVSEKKTEAEEKKPAPAPDEKEKKEAPADPAEEKTEEINADDLFKHRVSINMTPENSWFSASEGGLISLKIINAEGEEEFFERVVIRRSFPVTSPDEFLSVREPDTRAKGRGSEIGMIRDIHIFDKKTVDLINAELDIRYFTPIIKRITSAKEKFGYNYWEAETSAGKVSIVLNNPFSNIRVLEDGRIYIFDMDGNCFLIPDPTKLDRLTYRTIEIYL